MKVEPPVAVSSTGASASGASATSIFAPPREKPSGFAPQSEPTAAANDIKPITAIDAEIIPDDESAEEAVASTQSSEGSKKKRRKGKKKKN